MNECLALSTKNIFECIQTISYIGKVPCLSWGGTLWTDVTSPEGTGGVSTGGVWARPSTPVLEALILKVYPQRPDRHSQYGGRRIYNTGKRGKSSGTSDVDDRSPLPGENFSDDTPLTSNGLELFTNYENTPHCRASIFLIFSFKIYFHIFA